MSGALFLHGFGPTAEVPMSNALSAYAACALVVLSFGLVAALTGGGVRNHRPPGVSLPRVVVPRALVGACRVTGAALLCLAVVTGLWGPPQPSRNPSEYLVWVALWVGMVLLCAFVGDAWPLLNPFRALHDALSPILRFPPPWRLPAWLAAWPAVASYLAFLWLELCSGVSDRPRFLAGTVLAYSILTLAGMQMFGRDVWLRRCEGFTVLFEVVGAFAPLGLGDGPGDGPLHGVLRPWAIGLVRPGQLGADRAALILLVLGGLAFDSFEGTLPWLALGGSAAGAASLLVKSAGLLATALLFLAVFSGLARLIIYFGASPVEEEQTMAAFAFCLVPIALAYHAAHYGSYLVLQGQAFARLLGAPVPRFDPFTAPAALWAVQVALVTAGHVTSVYLGHRVAVERFDSASKALLSQYPMLVLMLAYTVTSLWLLAGGRPP